MTRFALIIGLLITLFSCKQTTLSSDGNREMFDAKGLHVITVFANRIQQTMSVMYGNEAAVSTALSGYQQHTEGERFTLVTYEQTDNKYWYGSYINGRVKHVESVTYAGQQLQYTIEQGNAPTDGNGNAINSASRIAYIFSHRPVVFP